MCEPTVIASTLATGASQVASHQAGNAAIDYKNRAKLRNFEEQNRQYDRDVMFDRAQYRNDMQLEDIQQDDVYRAMIDQWTEQDVKLNKLFADADMKLEDKIREMYQNEYAGTQTGATAARLAGKSAKEMGFAKSKILHNLMMGKEEAIVSKDRTKRAAEVDSRKFFEEVRYAPIHGPTPIAPELEAKQGMGGLILGLAGTAFGGIHAAGQSGKIKGLENKVADLEKARLPEVPG